MSVCFKAQCSTVRIRGANTFAIPESERERALKELALMRAADAAGTQATVARPPASNAGISASPFAHVIFKVATIIVQYPKREKL